MSHGLVQQTGQFVDDASAVVDTLVAVADCVLLVDAADLAIDERSTVRTVGTTDPVVDDWAAAVERLALPRKMIMLSGFWFIGGMAIGLMVYRGFYFRAFDLSGILQSGFWFIGEFVIGLLVYRGIGYRAFDLSGFCYRANGHRALAIGLMSCSQ